MAVGKMQARCEGCRCVAGGEQSEAGSVEPVECQVGLVESIDSNQGIEGSPSSKPKSQGRKRRDWESNEARVMSQTNCDESITKK